MLMPLMALQPTYVWYKQQHSAAQRSKEAAGVRLGPTISLLIVDY